MNKKTLLVASLACVGLLAACGGTPATSEGSKDVVPSSSSSSSQAPVEVSTIYEHQFVFNSPGKDKDSGEENTLVEKSFENTSHGGPNYQLYINLLKEDNKVEAGRSTMYYSGMLINKSAMSTSGTWSKNSDGTYTINLDEFEYNVQGTGKWTNDASVLTSTADGNVTWRYNGCKKDKETGELVANPYETVLNTQKSFAGEYQGTYYSVTDYNATGEMEKTNIDSMEVTALADGTYTVKGAMEDSGISSFNGTISSRGVFSAEITRLDGTMTGLFYTDVDGHVKFNIDSEARERVARAYGTIID